MAQSNGSLAESFVNGAISGSANRMKIVEGPLSYSGTEYVHEGETALIGYDWAIYAKRGDSGRVVVFNGWREWADEKSGHSGHTTKQHLSLVENAADPTFTYDHRQAQCSPEPNSAKSMERIER